MGVSEEEVDRLLYADDPLAHILARAPKLNGAALLDRYNLDLARGVLLNALEMTVTARGGWKGIFRAVKLARLMYRVQRKGKTQYRVHLTGPASPFLTRPQRYGARFVRVVPAVARAPGWRLEAVVEHRGRRLEYALGARRQTLPRVAPKRRGRPPAYDSSWEEALARDFAQKLGEERAGWTLVREETPLTLGPEIFLPDFTLRHRDGREALVELVGFWTPEYLEEKIRKVRAAGLENLILVVYRGLAAGESDAEPLESAAPGRVLWFANKPRIGPVLEAAERVAARSSSS
jgi:predicted nuclease of restriction endonuclease-like RecB superfamily